MSELWIPGIHYAFFVFSGIYAEGSIWQVMMTMTMTMAMTMTMMMLMMMVSNPKREHLQLPHLEWQSSWFQQQILYSALTFPNPSMKPIHFKAHTKSSCPQPWVRRWRWTSEWNVQVSCGTVGSIIYDVYPDARCDGMFSYCWRFCLIGMKAHAGGLTTHAGSLSMYKRHSLPHWLPYGWRRVCC